MTDTTNLGLDVISGDLDPSTIWADHDEYIRSEADSKKVWDAMPDEDRTVLVDLVQEAMTTIKQTVPDWLPYSMTVDGGKFVEVKFRILLSEIDKKKRLDDHQLRTEVSQAAQEAQELITEIDLDEKQVA